MTALSNNWVDEDRPQIVESIVDAMVSEMTLEEMRQFVWDSLYDDLIHQRLADLMMHVEYYSLYPLGDG